MFAQTIAQSMQPPLCPGHREASVIRTVKKGGENQGEGVPCIRKQHNARGKPRATMRLLAVQCFCAALVKCMPFLVHRRQFFVCARADGPPPHGKCDFFQWAARRTVRGSGTVTGNKK